MSILEFEDAKRVLEELAAERPDYVYEPPANSAYVAAGLTPPCRYSDDDGNPSCIIGHVFARLLPEDFTKLVMWEADHEFTSTVVASALVLAGVSADEKTERLLKIAQWRQDNGYPWGDAVQNALDFVRTRFPEEDPVA